jgi:hypothetical protein
MRQPIVEGRFYSGTERGCAAHLARLDAVAGAPSEEPPPEKPVAAIVPHAGWDCSGHVAMRVFRLVQQRIAAGATFIIFGAVHSYGVARASIYARGSWQTPLGPLAVDEPLAEKLLQECGDVLVDDAAAHAAEHSIEVQLPMLRYVFGECRIVPIAAPPRKDMHELGRRVAEVALGEKAADRPVFFLGTTDLTHYGEANYNFAPHGRGQAGLDWVKRENDPRMIDLMRHLKAEDAVAEAHSRQNACGGGAVAATLAAARFLGSTGGRLVEYTTSYDVLREHYERTGPTDFVGYAGMIF